MEDKNKDLIDIILDTEEWTTFEVKRALAKPAQLLETVVSFSNTDGGILVLGIEDVKKSKGYKRVVGVNEGSDNISDFLKLIDKEIEDAPKYTTITLDVENNNGVKDTVLVVSIKKSGGVLSLKKGDTYVRRGSQNVKIGANDIKRLQYEKGVIKYEDEISDNYDLSNLDLDLLDRYKKDTNSNSTENWQFLKDNGLAIKKDDKLSLTKTAILLFAFNPAIILKSKCSIKISYYHGNEANNTGEPNFVEKPFTIEGNLLSQIDQTLNFFRKVVNTSQIKLEKGLFKSSYLIPEWAFQEAIVNAVIHRNYFIENDIQIRFFDNRIEIESPGTYPGHVTSKNIKNERFARNPMLQRVLNRFQESPNLDIGEGVDRMFGAMNSKNLYEPFYFPASAQPNSVLLLLFNLHKVEHWDKVDKYLESNSSITNSQARIITGVKDTLKMSRLLSDWVNKRLLEKTGLSKKDTQYKKFGSNPIDSLLSKAQKINSNI